jgi:hypothetical protein
MFLMPFSHFFGHYVSQYYKVEDELSLPGSDQEACRACFERVVRRLLAWDLTGPLGKEEP